jgi:cytochrome P450
MLAMFPEAEAKIYAEIMENCPNGEIDAKNIGNLKYMECVMNETMRLFPIILTYVRRVAEDMKLDGEC